MRKKILTLFACWLSSLLFFSHSSIAQLIPNYVFSQQTGGAYALITDSTVIASGPGLDSQAYFVQLPFTFNFDNTNYSNIYVAVNGYVSLGTTNPGTSYWMIKSASTGFRVISVFDGNLASSTTANSEIAYKISGAAPNRKCIIQWKNMGYSGSSLLNANFQLELNEGTNLIEMVYGNCSVGGFGNNISFQIGLRGLNNTVYQNRSGYSNAWANTVDGNASSANMVLQSGANAPSGIRFIYTPPPPCVIPSVQPTNLQLTAGVNNVSVSYTAPNPAPSKYLIVRTPDTNALNTLPVNGTTYTAGGTLGNGTIVYAGFNTTYNNTGLTQLTKYTYTVFPFNDNAICVGGPMPYYNTTFPLSGHTETEGPRTYTWVPASGSGDWTVASNWTPARMLPLTTDTILFSSGTTVNVTNIPSQTIKVLTVANNTDVTLNGAAAGTLTLNSKVYVDSGSSLTLGEQALKIAFPTVGAEQSIVHKLKLRGRSVFNARYGSVTINNSLLLTDSSVYLANGSTLLMNGKVYMDDTASFITGNGTITLNDTVNLLGNAFFNTTSAVLNVNSVVNNYGPNAVFSVLNNNSTCNCKFNAASVYNHMRNGGALPRGTFNSLSTINITGITNTTPTMYGSSIDYGTFIWNCPGQSADINNIELYDSVRNLLVLNTGTNWIRFYGATKIYNEFRQVNSNIRLFSSTSGSSIFKTSGNANLISGILDITTAANNYDTVFYVSGNLFQATGHSVTNSSTSLSKISFNGLQTQHFDINGNFGSGQLGYYLNNTAGIDLTGNLYVTSAFTIVSGKVTGSGSLTYEPGASLNYNVAGNRYATAQEWPVQNGPQNIGLLSQSQNPYNRIHMPPGDRAAANLTITNGVLVLDSSNLKLLNLSSGNSYTAMVATNSSGSLFYNFPAGTGSQTKKFPVGDIVGSPEYSPVTLNFTSNTLGRYIGVRVADGKHPEDTSSDNYLSRYWAFKDEGGTAAYSCTGSFQFPSNDVNGMNLKVSYWNGNNWAFVPSSFYTIGQNSILNIDSSLTATQYALNNSVFAAHGITPQPNPVYTWTGAVNKEFAEPQNWDPARLNVTPKDVLQFNSGNVDSVKNVTSGTLAGLFIKNNTTAIFQAYSNGTTLTINSDSNITTREFQVDAGASFYMSGANVLNFTLKGDSCIGVVNGSVVVDGGTYGANKVTVDGLGSSLIINGTFTTKKASFVGVDSNSYIIYGVFEHARISPGGDIPNAIWKDGSIFRYSSLTATSSIIGYTGATVAQLLGQPEPLANFYKVIYDCPLQTDKLNWSIEKMNVRDSFIVNSTGTGKIDFAAYVFSIKHFIQKNGIVSLASSASNVQPGIVNISGSLIQENGVINNQNVYASVTPTLNFNGTAGRQIVVLKDAAPQGMIYYRISNPQGIQLVGTGALTDHFDIDTASAIYVSQPLNNPIQTTLRLNYQENASLIFDGIGNITPDSIIYPALNSPQKVTVNVGDTNRLIFSGSRVVGKELKMLSGDVVLDTTNLVIGTSEQSIGKLTYTSGLSGNIIVSSGSLTRWFNTTSSLPVAPDTIAGFYPLSDGYSKRHVSLYFSLANALSSGGTIKVGYSKIPGSTDNLSVADGTYTINSRSNSHWDFETGNGISLANVNSTLGMRLTCNDLVATVNAADIRIFPNNGVTGVHVAGAASPDVTAQRKTLSFGDLNGNAFYIGTIGSNIDTSYISIADGDWNAPPTWNKNSIPGISDKVYISPGDTVTVSANAYTRSIQVNQNGALWCLQNSLTVDSSILNYGTFADNGATVNLGTAGGGKSSFINNGVLHMVNGALNINGYLSLNRGQTYGSNNYPGTFIQSGGNINIDGNAGGVVVNSVPAGTSLFTLATPNIYISGGTITIIDPHAANSTTSYAANFSEPLAYSIPKQHTFVLGNGTSTDNGGTASGFIIYGSTKFLGKLVINGSPLGTNRNVTANGGCNLSGDLILNNNASFKADDLFTYGNITANAGTTLNLSTSFLRFLQDSTVNTPQFVGGGGNFGGNPVPIYRIDMNNANGVIFDIGDMELSGTLNFTRGILTLANGSSLKELINSDIQNASQTRGWVNGKLIRRYHQSMNLLYPIGDEVDYLPVRLMGTQYGMAGLKISVTNGDHPAISSSGINPSKSLNKIIVFDSTGSFSATPDFTISVPLKPGAIDPGYTWGYFGGAKYKDNSWTEAPVTALLSDTIKLGVNGNNIFGQYQIGEISASPVITQQPAGYLTCSGSDATFSVNAQWTDDYQWQLNDGNGWASLVDNNTYAGAHTAVLSIAGATNTMNGYQYRCALSNNVDAIYSDIVQLSVNTSVAPTIAISTTSNDTICAGASVTFTANATNAGLSPVYQWKVNGIGVQGNSNSLTLATLNNNDTVSCMLTSSSACAMPLTAYSNKLGFTVLPVNAPSITITVAGGINVCGGSNVIFTAALTNGGVNPVCQWKKNGLNVGTNSNTYASNSIADNDVITCVLTSNNFCNASQQATSNALTMNVTAPVTPTMSITASTSGALCAGSTVTFTASANNGASSPVYQWKKNGLNVGTNSNTYIDAALLNGDTITCNLTVSPPANSCYSATVVSSNALVMTVYQNVSPAVAISATPGATICSGESISFNATVTGGGATPVYQWKKNGLNIGSNLSTYTSAVWSNGDTISCIVAYNAGCYLQGTSNNIIVTVNPLIPVSVSVNTPQTTLCSGSVVLFTAVAGNGGASPAYQWKKNGFNVGANADTFSIVPVNGDVISCTLTTSSSCVLNSTANSNNITMTVNPIVTPGITITTSQTTICNGNVVVFTANAVNGGNSPNYQWKKNTINVGTNTATYTDATLNNGDAISCILTSNAACVSSNNATSNNIAMTVNPLLTPSVNITTSQNNICSGTNVIFTATATNGGSIPNYQWLKNNTNVGTNSNTYSDPSLANGDVISCILNSSESCVTVSSVNSNNITMNVTPMAAAQIAIATANENLCQNNTAVTVNASVVSGGSLPTYQWKKNGVNVGANLSSYSDPAIQNNDVIYCELVSNATCVSPVNAVSNNISFTVNPTYELNVNESICQGTSYIFGTQTLTTTGDYTEIWNTVAGCDSTVHLHLSVIPVVTPTIVITATPGTNIGNGQTITFDAVITNGGTAPSTTWRRNNTPVAGATGLSWQGIAGVDFANNDQISAQLNSNALCATSATVLSNTLKIAIQTVGIADNDLKRHGVELSPNPTNDIVFVKGMKTPGKVRVLDILGRKLAEVTYEADKTFSIPFYQLDAGTYMLLFVDSSGNEWSAKVIKD